MNKTVQSKREREKKLVEQMIVLYCKKNHAARNGLCPDCCRTAYT